MWRERRITDPSGTILASVNVADPADRPGGQNTRWESRGCSGLSMIRS